MKSRSYQAAEMVVRSLGVTCANISVRQFISALELLHRDSEMINSITKELLPAVMEAHPGSTRDSVERNLRSARDAIMRDGDPDRLREVVGYRVRLYPSVGDLLDTINYYMEREDLWPEDE